MLPETSIARMSSMSTSSGASARAGATEARIDRTRARKVARILHSTRSGICIAIRAEVIGPAPLGYGKVGTASELRFGRRSRRRRRARQRVVRASGEDQAAHLRAGRNPDPAPAPGLGVHVKPVFDAGRFPP